MQAPQMACGGQHAFPDYITWRLAQLNLAPNVVKASGNGLLSSVWGRNVQVGSQRVRVGPHEFESWLAGGSHRYAPGSSGFARDGASGTPHPLSCRQRCLALPR
jgi:hypothetical protein